MYEEAMVFGFDKTPERQAQLEALLPNVKIKWCEWLDEFCLKFYESSGPQSNRGGRTVVPRAGACDGDVPRSDIVLVNFSNMEDAKLGWAKAAFAFGVTSAGMSPAVADCPRALAAGAGTFLLETEATNDQQRHLAAAMRGEVSLSASCAKALFEHMQQVPSAFIKSARLSRRELELLRLLSSGASVARAADVVGVSYHTANTYVRRMYQKLGVRSRTQLIGLMVSGGSAQS